MESAGRDNTPIFLSIGYSSCHWCTVMEGEAFSDHAIAAYLNTNGFFYAAQDADNCADADDAAPEEGDCYVCGLSELRNVPSVSEQAALMAACTVSEPGNFEGRNVLQRRDSGPLSDIAVQALEKLFARRYGSSLADTLTFMPAVNAEAAKEQSWPGRIPPMTFRLALRDV